MIVSSQLTIAPDIETPTDTEGDTPSFNTKDIEIERVDPSAEKDVEEDVRIEIKVEKTPTKATTD